ncbi:MAG: P1 family peptidase [Rhodobacter sp.]|nr:P1 family peptidase [Rhodobacter sp.]
MRPGARNLITDVAGLRVGNAEDHRIKTGVTVLTADQPFAAAVHVMGGAPGTRETDLLAPENMVQQVDALVLSGGSALGLDAAGGVANALRAQGRGYDARGQNIPIVPGAILMDLLSGGDKTWSENPYVALGKLALDNAGTDFALGTTGAGTGATCADLKGGLGSASIVLDNGITVGALAAANPLGSVVIGEGPQFWAGPFEIGDEFGGLGQGHSHGRGHGHSQGHSHGRGHDPLGLVRTKINPQGNTAIAIVATDAALTRTQAKRMAIAAHDGIARAILPSHTPFDGDLVFAVATGAVPISDPILDALLIGHAAATCLSRAIARAVFLATAAPDDVLPCWADRFGG